MKEVNAMKLVLRDINDVINAIENNNEMPWDFSELENWTAIRDAILESMQEVLK